MFVQLYRKNSPNKGRSEAIPFTYKPNRFKRKQARPPPSIPTVVASYELFGSPSSSSSFQGTGERDQMANDNFGSDSHRQEQEQEDSEIINLILKITAEGYESPTSDISSIVRDLRGGYEIDAVTPQDKGAQLSSLDKLKLNETLFDSLVKSIKGDKFAFADLLESGKIEDIELLTLLIAKYNLTNALKSSRSDIDQNVLHIAIQRGYFSMFKVFLSLGVDVNQQDAFGNSPLHLAVDANPEYINALLSTKKVSLNKVNDRGDTPLSVSVSKNNLTATKLLIETGADPRVKNANGFNSLHVAVNLNEPSFDMIKYLVEFDHSMLFAESNGGKDVLQLAIANGLPQDITNYLSTFNDETVELEIDEICLDKLCKIFDSSDNWKNLATLMDIEEKIGEWEILDSPSKALFSFLKVS